MEVLEWFLKGFVVFHEVLRALVKACLVLRELAVFVTTDPTFELYQVGCMNEFERCTLHTVALSY